eukprot:10286370-Heterocapsa_arctica.AAC.1
MPPCTSSTTAHFRASPREMLLDVAEFMNDRTTAHAGEWPASNGRETRDGEVCAASRLVMHPASMSKT